MLSTIWSFLLNIWKIVAGIAVFISIPSFIYTYQSYAENKDPKAIISKCIKYETGDAVLLLGTLKNNDSTHADRLTLKGKTKGNILDFSPDPDYDSIVKKEFKNGIFELELNRLSVNANCNFELIAQKGFEIIGPIKMGWGKGTSKILDIKTPDDEEKKLLSAFDKANKLSNSARENWLRNNPL